MEDFLGNIYGVGDRVVYAAMSGRCVNMIHGEVLEIIDTDQARGGEKLKIQPLKSSRWKQHGSTRWVDTRTGKGIDPFSGNGKHIKTPAYEIFEDTGERVPAEYNHWLSGYRRTRYVPTVFHDYVSSERVGAKPVTIEITRNVVKVG